MAQLLDYFEEHVEPLIPRDRRGGPEIDNFKGMCRMKLNAVKVDTIEVLTMPDGMVQNEAAYALKDPIHPHPPNTGAKS